MICIAEDQDIAIENNQAKSSESYIKIRLLPCKGKSCDVKRTEKYFETRQFRSILQKPFVDFKDTANSIKAVPSEEIFDEINLNAAKEFNVYLKQVNFTYLDRFLQIIFSPTSENFLTVDSTEVYSEH